MTATGRWVVAIDFVTDFAITAGTAYGINPNYGSYVGSELDIVASYAATKYLGFEAGYGHFFRGDYIRESLSKVGTRDADWVYIQTRITF